MIGPINRFVDEGFPSDEDSEENTKLIRFTLDGTCLERGLPRCNSNNSGTRDLSLDDFCQEMRQIRVADSFVAHLENLLGPVWLRGGIDRNVAREAFVRVMHSIGLDLPLSS